jgi:hypothetical protein
MNAQERIAELTQKMLRRKLYAIFGKTVVPPGTTDAVVAVPPRFVTA